MENQHELIEGYRDLTQEQIDLINRIKGHASEVGALCYELAELDKVSPRWLELGRTDLQKGFMSLTRAVARPDTF